MSQSFGQFPSLSAFLESYKKANKAELLREALDAPPSIAARRIRRVQRQQRDVVEVEAVLAVREPDDNDPSGGRHLRLRVHISAVLSGDPDVSDDIDDAVRSQRDIFVAVRIGDAMGIEEPIEGLDAGAALHLRGEWITRERAQSHGGERMSVLHFTHHPVGFTCTSVRCYA